MIRKKRKGKKINIWQKGEERSNILRPVKKDSKILNV